MLNVQIHGFGFGVTDNAKEAIDFIKQNNIKGPIYNNFDIGNDYTSILSKRKSICR